MEETVDVTLIFTFSLQNRPAKVTKDAGIFQTHGNLFSVELNNVPVSLMQLSRFPAEALWQAELAFMEYVRSGFPENDMIQWEARLGHINGPLISDFCILSV